MKSTKSSKTAKKNARRKPRPRDREAPRPAAPPQILELEALREKALIEIGNAFRELLPSAIDSARRGKPAALRMIARWFRMPTAQPKYQALNEQIDQLSRKLAQAEMRLVFDSPQKVRTIDERAAELSGSPQTPQPPGVQKELDTAPE